jgi:dTDP-4-amino-4,6-dideoxygalactose transaminase
MKVMPTRPPQFPLTRPVLPKPEAWLPYLQTAYDNHYFTNFGPNEQLLSRRLADRFCPQGEVVLTCNATAALTATLMALGVQGVVAVPAFTFPATLQAIGAAGCQPLLLDVDPVTWETQAETVARAMERTRIDAVMPVRAFGFVRDHEEMITLAAQRDIPVVFDAAAALGHSCFSVGEHAPSYAEVFSLHATKSFAAGEGGAVFCAPSLAVKIRRAMNFGLRTDRSFTDGMNAKMSEFQAAVGLAALDMLEPLLARRQAMADLYQRSLKRLNSITLPVQTQDCPWSLFPVLTAAGTDVPALIRRALAFELQLRRYYHPSLVSGYKGKMMTLLCSDELPVAERLSEHMVCLPVYADANDEELSVLSSIVSEVFDPTQPACA